MIKFDLATQSNLNQWLKGTYDEETKQAILQLIQKNPKEIIDAFYTSLSFGTGGIRGVMGVGSNRINIYTIRTIVQGVAQYIHSNKEPGKKGVFIGYDSRHHSRMFAEEVAKVLAGNQIPVFLCSEIRPTPFVSFGCRYKQCQAAIAITASHNPAEYNGLKVFWSDGGQISFPRDKQILEEINKTTSISLVDTLSHPLIESVKEEVDEAYLEAINSLQHYPELNQKLGRKLKLTYSSLHGTGITFVPKALSKWGFHQLNFVEKQIIPDGDFPTLLKPNPEEEEALKLGIEAMKQQESDLLIATDPDADRVGIVVKHQEEYRRLNGNQIACLCLEHICQSPRPLPKKAACIKTLVTTELFQAIARAHHIPCFNVLPGFKHLSKLIHSWESEPEKGYQFLFGAEESYGYLLGSFTRDKDGILSSALIAEVALKAKMEGKTLIDRLNDLHLKYGNYAEEVCSHLFPETKEGREQIERAMKQLQNFPPTHLLNRSVIDTYKTSNVITFWLEDQTKLTVRPSGTEPKIKFYCEVRSINPSLAKECIHAIKAFLSLS